MIKGKRSSQTSTPSKQWKSVRSSEGSLSSDHKRTGSATDLTVSTAQVPAASQGNLPTKQRSKRKMYLPRSMPSKEIKSSQNTVKRQVNKYSTSAKVKTFFFSLEILQQSKVQNQLMLFIFICRKSFLVACHHIWFVDGALLSGFIVQ